MQSQLYPTHILQILRKLRIWRNLELFCVHRIYPFTEMLHLAWRINSWIMPYHVSTHHSSIVSILEQRIYNSFMSQFINHMGLLTQISHSNKSFSTTRYLDCPRLHVLKNVPIHYIYPFIHICVWCTCEEISKVYSDRKHTW